MERTLFTLTAGKGLAYFDHTMWLLDMLRTASTLRDVLLLLRCRDIVLTRGNSSLHTRLLTLKKAGSTWIREKHVHVVPRCLLSHGVLLIQVGLRSCHIAQSLSRIGT